MSVTALETQTFLILPSDQLTDFQQPSMVSDAAAVCNCAEVTHCEVESCFFLFLPVIET